MTTAYRQPTELGVHCPWSRFYAKPFHGGRRRAESIISMDVATGRRPPGFDWAIPLVLVHARIAGEIIIIRSAPPLYLNPESARDAEPQRMHQPFSTRTTRRRPRCRRRRRLRRPRRRRPRRRRLHHRRRRHRPRPQSPRRRTRRPTLVIADELAVVQIHAVVVVVVQRLRHDRAASSGTSNEATRNEFGEPLAITHRARANQDETDEETVIRKARRNSTTESCRQAHTNRANNRRTDTRTDGQEAQAERAAANTDGATRAGGSRGASTTSGRAAGTACACNAQARKQRDNANRNSRSANRRHAVNACRHES